MCISFCPHLETLAQKKMKSLIGVLVQLCVTSWYILIPLALFAMAIRCLQWCVGKVRNGNRKTTDGGTGMVMVAQVPDSISNAPSDPTGPLSAASSPPLSSVYGWKCDDRGECELKYHAVNLPSTYTKRIRRQQEAKEDDEEDIQDNDISPLSEPAACPTSVADDAMAKSGGWEIDWLQSCHSKMSPAFAPLLMTSKSTGRRNYDAKSVPFGNMLLAEFAGINYQQTERLPPTNGPDQVSRTVKTTRAAVTLDGKSQKPSIPTWQVDSENSADADRQHTMVVVVQGKNGTANENAGLVAAAAAAPSSSSLMNTVFQRLEEHNRQTLYASPILRSLGKSCPLVRSLLRPSIPFEEACERFKSLDCLFSTGSSIVSNAIRTAQDFTRMHCNQFSHVGTLILKEDVQQEGMVTGRWYLHESVSAGIFPALDSVRGITDIPFSGVNIRDIRNQFVAPENKTSMFLWAPLKPEVRKLIYQLNDKERIREVLETNLGKAYSKHPANFVAGLLGKISRPMGARVRKLGSAPGSTFVCSELVAHTFVQLGVLPADFDYTTIFPVDFFDPEMMPLLFEAIVPIEMPVTGY